MWRAANERTAVAAFALTLALAATPVRADAPDGTVPGGQGAFAPALDNETVSHAAALAREKARTTALHKWAAAALIMFLVLICFIVGVMIVTRRLRIRYLHYDRPVKFSRLWDVWWGRGDGKDPPKS